MAVFPEEQTGLGRLDAARRKPADLLARSGLPVPDLRGSEATDLELFNTDFRRLVSRIAKLFSIIAPTTQGTVSDTSTILAPHHQQHEKDGSDQVNVTGLPGVLANDQNPVPHDIQGLKHTAESLTIGNVLRATAPDAFAFQAIQLFDLPVEARTRQFMFTLRRTEILVGEKDVLFVPRKAELLGWVVASDTVASIQFDIWRASAAVPSSGAQSIVGGGNKPKMVAQNFRQEVPAGWTSTTLNVDDVVIINVDTQSGFSATSVVTLGLALLAIP